MSPCRRLTKKDLRLWEVIQHNLDLLKAYLKDYLLYPWLSLYNYGNSAREGDG
jgi:hypothetical protein